MTKKKEQEFIAASLSSLKVSIDSVHPDPQNVRKHPESNKAAIKKSLQGFQQRKPIVVNKPNPTKQPLKRAFRDSNSVNP